MLLPLERSRCSSSIVSQTRLSNYRRRNASSRWYCSYSANQIYVTKLTSHTADTEIIAALSSGADVYCIKGIDFNKLLTAIAIRDGATYLDVEIAQKIVHHLQINPVKKKSRNTAEQLSKRELEVLELIVEGYSNPEIGKQLDLSTNTIKTYVRSIMNKLMVSDRVQAAVTALRSGIVQ